VSALGHIEDLGGRHLPPVERLGLVVAHRHPLGPGSAPALGLEGVEVE
jgi:hypothetical protein